MSYKDYIIIEFHEETRIMHLSAHSKIYLNDEEELNEFALTLREEFTRIGKNNRFYIAIIVVDPELTKTYQEKVMGLIKEFICPDGYVRYGFSITRVTVMKSSSESNLIENLFSNKEDAFDYLRSVKNSSVETKSIS